MLGDAAFDVVGQMPIRSTDQPLDFPLRAAVTRLLNSIEKAAQNGAEAPTNRSRCCAAGTVPLHATGYREPIFQPETKLNDGTIVCADNDTRDLARAYQNSERRARIGR